MLRRGQAMVESLLAVLIITSLFFGLFTVSRMLMGKIVVEHAAMRVARARAVGLNHFMCVKAARIAAIPSSGKRILPDKNDARGDMSESALARMYMRTPNGSYADALLRYEYWDRLGVHPGQGGSASTTILRTDLTSLSGEAHVDTFPIYLNDEGL